MYLKTKDVSTLAAANIRSLIYLTSLFI